MTSSRRRLALVLSIVTMFFSLAVAVLVGNLAMAWMVGYFAGITVALFNIVGFDLMGGPR